MASVTCKRLFWNTSARACRSTTAVRRRPLEALTHYSGQYLQFGPCHADPFCFRYCKGRDGISNLHFPILFVGWVESRRTASPFLTNRRHLTCRRSYCIDLWSVGLALVGRWRYAAHSEKHLAALVSRFEKWIPFPDFTRFAMEPSGCPSTPRYSAYRQYEFHLG